MTFADVETNINTRFGTVATAQDVRLVRDNDPEPTGMATAWIRLRVSASTQELLSMGNSTTRKWRLTGQWAAELNVPNKRGTSGSEAPMRELFAAIQTQFRGVTVASPDIRYMPPVPGEIQNTEPGWARRTVTGRFTYDEVG
jgi:hypothetical protein